MTTTANTERLHTKPFRVTSRKARDHQNDTNTGKRATSMRRTTFNAPAQIRGANSSGKNHPNDKQPPKGEAAAGDQIKKNTNTHTNPQARGLRRR